MDTISIKNHSTHKNCTLNNNLGLTVNSSDDFNSIKCVKGSYNKVDNKTSHNNNSLQNSNSKYNNSNYNKTINDVSNFSQSSILKLKSLLSSDMKKLRIIHINIRSLNANNLKLYEFLNSVNFNFDIIVLSEIWVININIFSGFLNDFTFIYDLPLISQVGGLGMYIRNNIGFKIRADLNMNVDNLAVENIWIELEFNSKQFLLGGIYRHPNSNINQFTNKLDDIITLKDMVKFEHVVIIGDINIDSLKYNMHNDTTFYFDNLFINNYLPLIIAPTRTTCHSSTIIDHIYLKNKNGNKNCIKYYTGTVISDVSDHLPIYIIFNFPDKNHNGSCLVPIYTRVYNRSNYDSMDKYLNKIVWDELFSIDDVNMAYTFFEKRVTFAFNSAFPLTKISKKNINSKQWFTNGLKSCSKIKNRLYYNWVKDKNQINKNKYLKYKRIFEKACHTSKVIYYNNKFNLKINSIKSIWSNVKNIILNRPKNAVQCNKLIINDIEYTNNRDIVEKFNIYYRDCNKITNYGTLNTNFIK